MITINIDRDTVNALKYLFTAGDGKRKCNLHVDYMWICEVKLILNHFYLSVIWNIKASSGKREKRLKAHLFEHKCKVINSAISDSKLNEKRDFYCACGKAEASTKHENTISSYMKRWNVMSSGHFMFKALTKEFKWMQSRKQCKDSESTKSFVSTEIQLQKYE